jgi:2-dehydropantoate 2-reductase
VRREGAPLICIYGAGSVGCLIGGLLSRTADVVLIGRARIAGEVAAHGLTLTSWRGEHLRVPPGALRYATDGSAAAPADLVLATVKSGATLEAGRELAAVLKPSALVISFQNGIGNAELLRQHLPRQVGLAGMVPFNVVHRGEGGFHRASAGELAVEEHPALGRFAPLFADAGLPLAQRRDMKQVQWAKLLLNLNNPINALADLPLTQELARRDYRRCLALLQREALRVLDAAHIRPARLTPLPPHWLPALLDLPDALFRILASRMLEIDPLARSSTFEDLRAGRRTEIDYINGEVVRLAQKQGLAAPMNARLIELIHAAEAGGRKRFGGAELLGELRLANEENAGFSAAVSRTGSHCAEQ